jgi:thiamine biosynthesis protein ThiS
VNGVTGVRVEVNGEPREVPAGCTVAGLLELLELARGPVAVERNLELVPRTRQAETVLEAGDRLEVVTLVGGG